MVMARDFLQGVRGVQASAAISAILDQLGTKTRLAAFGYLRGVVRPGIQPTQEAEYPRS
jgi:hypothetical protein